MTARSNIRVLTGTRIRQRRADLGLRQAELAGRVEISPSYLNLIEHNHRRIAGKLLSDIARALSIEPSALAEGAENALVTELRAAGASFAASGVRSAGSGAEQIDTVRREGDGSAGFPIPELSRTEEFASRFPGWAAVQAAAHRRIAGLERTVETLSDRLTHDPYLSDALHDVLSVVTAIRSTAGILAGDEALEPVWQRRFQKNLHEDARRLSESAATLVHYLDQAGDAEKTLSSPQEELDACFARLNWHVPALEPGAPPGSGAGDGLDEDTGKAKRLPDAAAQIVQSAPEFTSDGVRSMALEAFESYARDAANLPLDQFLPEARACNWDPAVLSLRFGVSLAAVMRRLATLPPDSPEGAIGRISCDGAGSLSFRKPPPGFVTPRFGGGCALWPLFQALGAPGQPIARWITQDAGRSGGGAEAPQFLAYACAVLEPPESFGAPVLAQAHMVLIPSALVTEGAGGGTGAGGLSILSGAAGASAVGSNCRVCLRTACRARREPSILSAPPEENVQVQ